MMTKKFSRKVISVLLSVVMAVTGLAPVTAVFAGDGVEGLVDLQIFYAETDTIVPTYEEDGTTAYKEYITEGDEIKLKYKLIDSKFPDNGYVKWYSEAPALVDVTQEGVVKGFDSSKGAVIRVWIDNEVRTIPIVGGIFAKVIEKALFNDYIDLDSMDTEGIVEVVEKALGSESIIANYIEAYEGKLVDSLRTYLDNINSNVHCTLYDGNGEQVADDIVQFVVTKNDEWYAAFLPNGTHITNKSQVPTTVAKGSTVQLYAITTPQRLGFGTVYSVKSSSIFSQGKVVATVDDSGLVTFKNTGEVTIMVSPNSEDVVNSILKLVNYIYTLENTGVLDTSKIADILIKYMGVDINRTVLTGLLDAAFAVAKIAGGSADPIQLTATAVEIIANIILQMKYNDSITFTVVDAEPIEDFEIKGNLTVKEGAKTQLSVDNIQPTAGDTTDIVWRSSDPTIASVDAKTGVVTGLDAGGSLGALSSQTCTIYALSQTNRIERSVTVTVTGKTGKYISQAVINGKTVVDIAGSENYSYTIYPSRVADGENLYITWGMVSGTDEEGETTYIWADNENEAVDPDRAGKIDYRGHFTPINGGVCTIAMKAITGYQLSDGSFYTISSYIATKEVTGGIPVTSINVSVDNAIGNNARIGSQTSFSIGDKNYDYTTIHIGVGNAYNGKGAKLSATVYPNNATYKDVTWVVDNTSVYNTSVSGDTHSIEITQKSAKEYTDMFNVYAVSSDGEVISNAITVCVTRNYATGNTIDQRSITMTNYGSGEASHTMTFDGSWTSGAYACYDANWYSSDESVFTVESKGNDNSDAVLSAKDVGTATLYCVSADGAITDTIPVTVKPNKTRLKNIISLCENTIVLRTSYNRDDYKKYMRALDLAYIVMYEEDMASQTTVDTYAQELLTAFIKVGGFVGISGIEITGTNKQRLEKDFITVEVGSTKNYTKYSYDLDYIVNPKNAMYSDIQWISSNESISVDKNGVCTPTSNDACAATITCQVTDYSGNVVSDTVNIAFAKTKATGVELNTNALYGALIGTTTTLQAKVLPKNSLGNSTASIQDVTWYSTDTNIATVDENGKITFLYGGNAYIVCETKDGGYTSECFINVKTNYNNLQLLVDQYTDLSLSEGSYYPETWAPYAAALSSARAILAAKEADQKTVDAKYNELQTAYNNLKKYVNIQKVELYLDGEPTSEFYQYDLRLLKEGFSYKNAKLDLNVRLYPNNATYTKAVWESSTDDISVTTDGVCTPTSNKACYGKITCTVTDSFGVDFTDEVWVSYSYYPVTAVNLSQESITGPIGSTYQLIVSIEPQGTSLTHWGAASIQDYYWESDDENVATVDETGLVTFVGAGSTIVRCVSYDGGVSGECIVSSQGDRSALKAALDEYADVDYTQYEYSYGIAFKRAYEEAEAALSDEGLLQSDIDTATVNLTTAYNALGGHPYIKVSSITVAYTAQKRSVSSTTTVKTGIVGYEDALSVDLSSGFTGNNSSNDIILDASKYPTNAMYTSSAWEVLESYKMNSSILSATSIKLTPTDKNNGAWAKVRIGYRDHYGNYTYRTIIVTMSDNVCTGLNLPQGNLSLLGTAAPYQLNYSVLGNPEFSNVIFTSSDEGVATVSQNGVVTPVDTGDSVITAKTLDGGFVKTVWVSVSTDYSVLARKVSDYETLVNDIRESDQYTEESLSVLSEQINIGKDLVNSYTAKQSEVNAAIIALDNAYTNLIGYTPATNVEIIVQSDQSDVQEVHDGFIRLKSTVVTNRDVRLEAQLYPEGSEAKTIEWYSDNEEISVDENGKVTNGTGGVGVAKITCIITNAYGEIRSASKYVSFVRTEVTGVSFEKDMIYGAPAEVKKIPVVINSSSTRLSASVTDCLYKSLDENIATVDASGRVTFVSQGTTQIKVTSMDGGYVGLITVKTTWDTTALQSVINLAKTINYQDYEYEYGTAINDAYEAAVAVYENPDSSQSAIDTACENLQTALNDAEGHPFVVPAPVIRNGDEVIESNKSYEVDDNGRLALDVSINGTMYQSYDISTSDSTDNITTQINGNRVIIDKTGNDDGATTINISVVDDYGNTREYEFVLNVVNTVKNIDSISITCDGEAVTTLSKSTDDFPLTLSYVINTEGASQPAEVTWSATNSNYVTIDEDGTLTLTTLGKVRSSFVSNIICTVTNSDGTTVSAKVVLTYTRT